MHFTTNIYIVGYILKGKKVSFINIIIIIKTQSKELQLVNLL